MIAETLFALTDDGWRVALHHYMAGAKKRRHPVLMVHGIAANRIHFDLTERYSLARAVQAHGFDVYVLELRGAGQSIAPAGSDRSSLQWGFGDFCRRDLPAAIQTMLGHANAPAFHALGHSMGGMLFYSHGVDQPAELRSLTAMGTPLLSDLTLAPRERRLFTLASRWPSDGQKRVPLKRVLGTAGRFMSLSTRLADGILFNTVNCDRELMQQMAKDAIDDIPFQLLYEIDQHMKKNKGEVSPYAYEDEMHRIHVPVLMLAGNVDRIAPAESVLAAAARLVTPDVRFRELGRRHGEESDYGHLDLLVGRHSPEEVYPLVLDFLEEMD